MTLGACVLVVAALAGTGVSLRAQTPAPAATLDQILKEISTYDGGTDSAALWKLRDYVYARKDDPAGRAECEAKLLQFLKTTATPVAKMAACRHLRVIGSPAAVPALQALLADDRTADMALYALQEIPGAAAGDALVQALKTTSGATKLAVITALGERKAAPAVPVLASLLPEPAFGGAAAIALGRIGGDAAAAALETAFAAAPADLKPRLASAMLACADTWLAAKNTGAARRLYEMLLSDMSLPIPLRRAAALGRIPAAGSGAAALLLDLLGGPDAVMQEAAIARIAGVIPPDAIDPVCTLLPRLPESAQVQVLAVLSGYPADRVLPAVLERARSDTLRVRLAAMRALESTGGPAVVPMLVETAARARGLEQVAARSALGMLKGRAVDEAIRAQLAQKPSDDIQRELLLAVADRRIFAAKSAVAAVLTSGSPRIRVQALKTLRVIGTPSDVPAVLDALVQSADESERAEAEQTTAALARKIANADGRAGALKARLATEKDAEARVRCISVLPLIGDRSTLPILRAALEDSSPEVVDAAVRAITTWP
ncbi:MAG: hypothetical protein IMZ44_16985, partial [Planctomycetes bacterium]|nr:hypothetical protein [Planctomycetota bacterium]